MDDKSKSGLSVGYDGSHSDGTYTSSLRSEVMLLLGVRGYQPLCTYISRYEENGKAF
jgi:hypothetical protein